VTGEVAREDQPASLGKSAAKRPAIAGEGSEDFFGFELPHLQRLVHRRRDRALPVRRHRHRSDTICVTREGLQLPSASQIPHFPRPVIRRRDRPLPVRRHHHCSDSIRESRPASSSCGAGLALPRDQRCCVSRCPSRCTCRGTFSFCTFPTTTRARVVPSDFLSH